MHSVVLGSAQDAGVPQIGCACDNCEAARRDPARARSAASIAVVHEGAAILLDTAPDIRSQWDRIPAPVVAVAWTHTHMGHVAGASQLGREGPDLRVPGIATPQTLRHLHAAAPHLGVDWRPLPPGGRTTAGPFDIQFHPINHRAETSDTVAIEIAAGGKRFLYLPDTDTWDEAVEAAIAGLGPGDALFFDATFWSADEIRHRNIAEIPHPFVSHTLPRLAGVAARGVRVLLTHLNHTNPLCDPASREHSAVLAEGIEVAVDGLRVG